MATRPSDIPGLEKQISGLQASAGTYQDKLNASPTALGGDGTPTSSDITDQESLQRIQGEIQGLNDTRLRTKWYGTDKVSNTPEEPATQGIFGKTLDFISRPLYGIVGATKHFIGQGSGSLQQDVSSNMTTNKNTFGDVLKSSNVPWGVAAPLGFALDVMMDPVNWVTMGGGALIPRIGIGAYRGLQAGEMGKGIALAAKSGVLEKATTIGKYTPYFKKSEAFKTLGEKSMASTDAYEALTKSTAADIVQKSTYRDALGGVMKKMVAATPGAENFIQHFIYDPVEWVRQARIKDVFQEKLGTGAMTREVVNAAQKGEDVTPLLSAAREKIVSTPPVAAGTVKYADEATINMDAAANIPERKDVELFTSKLNSTEGGAAVAQKMSGTAGQAIIKEADAVATINKNTKAVVSTDPVENANRITIDDALKSVNQKVGGEAITLEDIATIYNSGAMDQTGVKWFDNMMAGIRDYTIKIDKNSDKAVAVGKTTMDFYDRAMGIFRVAKVAASPTSWMNAVVGNMLMTHMAGGSIGPEFIGRLKQAYNMYRGKPNGAAKINDIMMDAGQMMVGGGDSIRAGLRENVTGAGGTFGSLAFLASSGHRDLAALSTQKLLFNAADAGVPGISSVLKAEDIAPEMRDAYKDLLEKHTEIIAKHSASISGIDKWAEKTKIEESLKSGKAMADATLHGDSGATVMRKAIGEKGIENTSRFEGGTGMTSQELFNSKVTAEMFNHIAEQAKANPNSISWKLLDYTFNKMPAGYESIDQSFKMATFLTATVDGYSMAELRRISKLVNINPEDIDLLKYVKGTDGKAVRLSKDGEARYRLTSKTALELANVMYLNYAAMPAAVRVIRNLPLLGSPFVSFMYGMALKTGQTLVDNPSAFNKVTFAMNDFGGTKDPLEKKALQGQFYSYLNQPGMFRTPFFNENPIYLNMSSMIPYYSLNMFNPSQTQYGNSAREKVAQAIQGSPLLKDPAGNALFENFILPLILGEAIRPQGQFGQPLYPVDATAVEKAGYGARNFGEAFVPNIAAYAGLVTPESVADYVPSYRWRQLAKAKNAKNQLGISGKEPAASRTIRTLLQASGVPVQAPVNKNFSQKP